MQTRSWGLVLAGSAALAALGGIALLLQQDAESSSHAPAAEDVPVAAPLPTDSTPSGPVPLMPPERESPSLMHADPAPAAERGSSSGCRLSLRVTDTPGGLPLSSFVVERAVWDDGQMPAASRIFVDDAEGRVEFDGLMCESEFGLRILPHDRPAKLFGPFVTHEGELQLELAVGRAATLLVHVAFESGAPVEGAVVGLDRPICDGCSIYERAVWPRIPTDERGIAEVRGLVSGFYVANATGAMQSSDLAELELRPGVAQELHLVLRDALAAGSLVVTVVDDLGPIPGKVVSIGAGGRVQVLANEEEPQLEGVTGDDGRCRFVSLPPDLYPISVPSWTVQANAVVHEGRETHVQVRLGD